VTHSMEIMNECQNVNNFGYTAVKSLVKGIGNIQNTVRYPHNDMLTSEEAKLSRRIKS